MKLAIKAKKTTAAEAAVACEILSVLPHLATPGGIRFLGWRYVISLALRRFYIIIPSIYNWIFIYRFFIDLSYAIEN